MATNHAARSTGRHVYKLYALIAVCISSTIAILMVESALGYYSRYIQNAEVMDPGFIQFDARLGWKLQPSWTGQHAHYDYAVWYKTDRYGFRSSSKPLQAGRERVIVLGDSFTFGLGANDAETFTARLNIVQQDFHFINGGVPGYSPDQLLLTARERVSTSQAERLLLVVYLGNDLIDIGLPSPVQAAYCKPYATFKGNQLEILGQPVPRRHEACPAAGSLYEVLVGAPGPLERTQLWQLVSSILPQNQEISAQAVDQSAQLLVKIISEIEARAGVPTSVLLLSGRSAFVTPGSLSGRYQKMASEAVVSALDKLAINYHVIDILCHEAPSACFHPRDGHLNAKGHQAVADHIRDALDTPPAKALFRGQDQVSGPAA